jgi:predicted transglutaminase-like cysteine proteinase
MRQTLKILMAALAIAVVAPQQHASAAFWGYPMGPRLQVERIMFDAPPLAPMAHTQFCLVYREDCAAHRITCSGGPIKVTAKRWADLVAVKAEVNCSIKPERNEEGLAGEKWLVSPKSGDCNDYAATKRHEVLARGWPARALLLVEVVTTWGEHHLVLIVRTNRGDFVADNMNAQIRPWS